MTNLIIDIGNTKIKYFIIEKGLVIDEVSNYLIPNINNEKIDFSKEKNYDGLLKLLSQYKITYCIVSSVNDSTENDNRIYKILKKKFDERLMFFNRDMNLPITVKYESKETLGLDRLAAVSGASVLLPNKNVLVIDAGTAITYDILNENNEYLGGNISPGIHLRYLALNKFTNKLPMLSKMENKFSNTNYFGKNTENAIHFGVENGIYFEVETNISRFNNIFDKLNVIFCGGDAFFFENLLKNSIFAEKNLVAIGLNKILELNV